MADDDKNKKIIVDDDWKEEARREKEKLARETEQRPRELPGPSLAELIDLVAVQAFVGLGLVAGPDGRPMPPNLDIAKHYIDLLQLLQDKTKGNLTAEEARLLERVLYQLRMAFVELSTHGAGAPPAGRPPTTPGSAPQAPDKPAG